MISLVIFDVLLSCLYFVHLYRLTLILIVKEIPVVYHWQIPVWPYGSIALCTDFKQG